MVAVFEQEFFIELYKAIKIYGNLFVTEDANIFPTEKQAKDRCAKLNKIAHLNESEVAPLRYAHITLSNWKFPPRDVAKCRQEMERLFDLQEIRMRRSEREAMKVPVTEILTDEEAMREMERMASPAPEISESEETESGEDMIKIGDYDFPFDDVRDAVRATIQPNLHARTGAVKIQNLIDSLPDDQKTIILCYLGITF